MNEELMLVYGWGPEEDGKLSSLLYIAETSLAMGMKTSIFLYTDAAILAKKENIKKVIFPSIRTKDGVHGVKVKVGLICRSLF